MQMASLMCTAHYCIELYWEVPHSNVLHLLCGGEEKTCKWQRTLQEGVKIRLGQDLLVQSGSELCVLYCRSCHITLLLFTLLLLKADHSFSSANISWRQSCCGNKNNLIQGVYMPFKTF